MNRERGSMAVETVLLAPVLLLFILFLVGAAVIVEHQGEVNGAARDAARAASVQRDYGGAQRAATDAARASLANGSCKGANVSLAGSNWTEGGEVHVEVSCTLDLGAVAGFGFAATKSMTSTAVAPLEQFRRIE
ncbi:TadE/TadG family type IV pilus assembly protein [Nonomuraea soli]|uniref:Flp pilus assembly protein TadG n=1 Tax=Nonomuraea soli TaxID=1032476 RepID=A0A7W0CKA1_9ACTN|nr:TadE/TadG family type IV pilus assembly protein [Nonomuraea soli]MBA2892520.1 Flp pilus assembly protein TadG [Nonomuraea soli]